MEARAYLTEGIQPGRGPAAAPLGGPKQNVNVGPGQRSAARPMSGSAQLTMPTVR